MAWPKGKPHKPPVRLKQNWETPPEVSPRVKAEYERIVDMLEQLGTRGHIDRQLAMQRAQAAVVAADAFAALEAEGAVMNTENAKYGTKKCNPAFLVWQRSSMVVAHLDRLMGLTCPRSKVRIEPEPGTDALSAFLARQEMIG